MTAHFTYTGPSVGAAFTAGVFNDAWDLATQKSVDALARTDAALALAASPVAIVAPGDIADPAIPAIAALGAMTPADVDARFVATQANVLAMFTSSFTGFLATHFPLGTYLANAQTWLQNALTTGGSGINAAVEDQLFERERGRITRDSQRAQEEVISTWASRRFPLPPGAAANQILQLQLGAAEKIGESSRTRAIEAFKMEIENVRFAVEKAIALRGLAVSSAGDYLRVLALGPQLGVQLSSAVVDAQAKFAGATADYYRAQVSGLDLPLRAKLHNTELTLRAAEANQRTSTEVLGQRVAVAQAAAHMLGTQAAAALNALHASASIQGQESL